MGNGSLSCSFFVRQFALSKLPIKCYNKAWVIENSSDYAHGVAVVTDMLNAEQPDLFEDLFGETNQISIYINSLNLSAAKQAIEKLKQSRQSIDLRNESQICEFFMEHLILSDVTNMVSTWKEFTETFKGNNLASNKHLKKNYFTALCKTIEEQKNDDDYVLNIPVGLFYIYAGDLKGAKARLEKAIVKHPDDARLSGYLGELHFLRGNVQNSRICYREAFEANPNGVDLDSISDGAVIDLINHVKRDVSNSDYIDWVVIYGCIEKIFPYKIIKILDDLRLYVNDFLKMETDYKKGKANPLKPKLFYKCMVLAESNQYLKHIRSVEFIKIRALMKDINPELFGIYMEGRK
ncbi:tetratricopeptide repeat protein [Candidatus Magnetominusculus dajiuhuensis]|uniref:tetratricopeptide repeat protein n=1 Tax=Candidatus Magnetominusculus dajiuhuensis TaxID=3137712 RepID=UPI003B427E01